MDCDRSKNINNKLIFEISKYEKPIESMIIKKTFSSFLVFKLIGIVMSVCNHSVNSHNYNMT